MDAGPYGRKTVVCGAPNCRPGVVSAYVPVGKKVIDGVESDGMLASAAELGINRDHSGIIELEAAIGAPVPGCAPDSVIEIDNKSITHRPDLWGHHGMAREVAAILGRKLKDPVRLELLPEGPAAVNIQIEDLNLCPRYSALVFENVRVRAFALVAAVPAHRHRPEPHQQHRRHDELRHGRAGAAHARLRCGSAARATPSSFAPPSRASISARSTKRNTRWMLPTW